ncbi:amidohydrolase [Gloeophyllum trabeum ATCC 11539]|uniref:Amidohydrolase n=1 Tax=Gloeophyllum trabeum (strain ATCC 11539 / FP-39264 / Madison 617) TaxID=670483 RepID=S7REZ6_GLOTA|nr:amidohydrolase [Gloeophyllum trabeum ATCC 11539]EPQ52815.1 amidohydrolase [Gloeophyllum trabeum ATCC 11539]
MSDSKSGCFGGLLANLGRRRSNAPVVEPYPYITNPSYSGSSRTLREGEGDFGGYLHKSCCDFGIPTGKDVYCVGGSEKSKTLPDCIESEETEIYRPEVMATIESSLDRFSPELRKLSLDIHDHPELGFQEKRTHDTLTAFMYSHGFKVTKHYLGLDTAWRAEWSHGKGGRVLGVNSEMDALPGIGHACGHNLIAICGVGVALALKDALQKHDIAGKIVLLGTPAEEGGGGKIILIERGGYKNMDVCLMSHPGPGPNHSIGIGPSLAVQSIEIEYHGHTAHASASPWEGINALDAAFLAYSNVAVLRQQIKPTHRVHGVIRGGKDELAANVIPDYTKMLWLVRAPSYAELEILRERVKACFSAAAQATGCRMNMTVGMAQYDLRQNSVLAKTYGRIMGARYDWRTTMAEGAIGGSTDFGNVTYELPALHPSYAIPTEANGGNHTPGFTASARTKEAHELCLTVTKGLAALGFRVLDDADFTSAVKKAYEREKNLRDR